MMTSRRSLPALVLSLVGVVGVVATARADRPIAKRAAEGIKPPSPPLAVAKKVASVNKAVKLLGAPALGALPPAQASVTPLAPRHAGGARIVFAAPMTFVALPSSGPDGSFVLTPANGAKAEVRIVFPAAKDKIHLVDCRLSPVWGGPVPVTFTRGSASQAVQPEDGHYLYTFKSDKASQTLSLFASSGIAFYGCELTRLD